MTAYDVLMDTVVLRWITRTTGGVVVRPMLDRIDRIQPASHLDQQRTPPVGVI